MKNITYGLLGLFCLLLSACFQADKACLDINATNFDVNADENCCCIYPVLRVNIIHRVQDSIPLSFDSTYQNALGQTYQIKKFAYYLSDFSLGQNGQMFYTIDTVQLRKVQASQDTTWVGFRADYTLVRRVDSPVHAIDTFPFDGTFDALQFRVGLKDSLRYVVPNSAKAGSPLRPQPELLYDSLTSEYVGLWLVLARDTNQLDKLDTLRFASSELPAPFTPQGFVPFTKVLGTDLELKIKVDYSILFKDTDMTSDLTTLKAKIIQNIPLAFSVF